MAVKRKKKTRTKARAKTTRAKKTRVKKTKTRKAPAKRAKTKTKRKASGLMKMMYELSDSLAEIVGSKKASRPQVVKQMWAYIKKHNLQDKVNRRMINPDKKLAAVLGKGKINMLKMAKAMNKHFKKAIK